MNPQIYLDEMQNIQEELLEFLEDDTNNATNIQHLKSIFDDHKICDDKYKFKSFLYLFSRICNNHHRCSNFLSKIEQILTLFKDNIKQYFTNEDIFSIFQKNKRILLFLIDEQIMVMEESIVKKITKSSKFIEFNYIEYFAPEIKPFVNKEWFPKELDQAFKLNKKLPENFYDDRKIGENNSYICKTIQKDLVQEFIIYCNKNNYSLNSKISKSIYETNNFLNKKCEVSLIEYAVFFGSIQIFNYLRMNGVQLTDSLWLFAVHGKNEELLHLLEENIVIPEKKKEKEKKDNEEDEEDEWIDSTDDDHHHYFDIFNRPDPILTIPDYQELFRESIVCHHNEFANYFLNIDLHNEEEYFRKTSNQIIKCYNFVFIKPIFKNTYLCYFCKYDHYIIADILLKQEDAKINDIFKRGEINLLEMFLLRSN